MKQNCRWVYALVPCLFTLSSGLRAQTNFDLQLFYTNSPAVVSHGQYFTFGLTVTTAGPDSPQNVVVSNRVPAGLEFVSARATRGVVTHSAGVISCEIDSIYPYSSVTLTVECKTTGAGWFTNSGGVSALLPDTVTTNNQVSLLTPVTVARCFGVDRPHAGYSGARLTPLPGNGQLLTTGAWPNKAADLYNVESRTFDVPAGALMVPRSGHTSTLMKNGQVLLAGGGSANGDKTAEVYNPVTQQFRRVGDMLVYSYSHRATLLENGQVLLCGGVVNPPELFDPATEVFSYAPDASCPPEGTLLPDGRFFQKGSYLPVIYDPATASSVSTTQMNVPRFDWVPVLISSNKVLLVGGHSSRTGTSDIAELYDIASGTYSLSARMTIPREGHGATLLADGTVLIVGGSTNGYNLAVDRAEVYDPNGTSVVPGVGVSDAVLVEGGAVTNMAFNIWLTEASAWPVTVNFATAPGTASFSEWGVAKYDYISTNGTVTIPPGSTNAVVYVSIVDNEIWEPEEYFTLNLALPIQGWIARSSGAGTIADDDPLPTVSVAPASLTEADLGRSNMVFKVSLSLPSPVTVSVDYVTAGASAVSGSDFLTTNGTLVFGSGTTSLAVEVPVVGDMEVEGDEMFTLHLTNAQNAVIGSSNAAPGTILNDDGIPGRLHHFEWSPIANPQIQTAPFAVTITARDYFGNLATNAPWPVRLFAQPSNAVQAANLDFEGPTLDPWVTFNYTPVEKSFSQQLANVAGLGPPSMAMRTFAGAGTNGFFQDIYLTGGISYTFSANIMVGIEGPGSSTCWGGGICLEVGSTNLWGVLPNLCSGYTRTTIAMVYTPPTDGLYTLRFTIQRPYYWLSDNYAVYIDDVRITCPPITPTLATNFVDGVWAGTIAGLEPATATMLEATDNAGHTGSSNPFEVISSTDLGLSVYTNWVSVLRTGDRLTFNLAVTNRGPSTALNAGVEWIVPPNLTYLNASNLQGTITNDGGTVRWNIGSLPKGSNAVATLQARADLPGLFTNSFAVTVGLPDVNSTNDLLAIPVNVDLPLLNLSDASAYETNAAATGMAFAVTVSGPSAQTISVDYFTANGTAADGVDYSALTGRLVFPPFVTNAFISVFALEDILDEPNRTFLILLTNPVNAVIGDGVGVGTVLDDDAPPAISIADTSVVEGDAGYVSAIFPLTLSKPHISDVTVRCTTAPGTADTNDYTHTMATVVFPAGLTNATFSVPVRGNTVNESNETFGVTLSLPSGATLSVASATGTIINDDAVPNLLDHFEFGPIASPQYTNVPFQLAIRAVDYRGTNVSFGGSLPLTVQTDEYYTFRMADDFEDGDLLGWTNYGSSSLVASNVTDAAGSGTRALRLSGKGQYASPYSGLRRTFTNGRPTRVSFAVRAAQTNAIVGRAWMVGGAGYTAFEFYMNKDGRLGLSSRNGFVGVPYVSNRWYRVDLDLNWTTRLVKCRIDGELVLSNVAFPSDPYSGSDYISVQNSENGTSWFDDFHVFDAVYTNLLVTPANVSLVGGTWTGAVTVARTGTNAYFTLADNSEHTGRSAYLDLLAIGPRLEIPLMMTETDGVVPAQVWLPISYTQAVTIALISSAPTELVVPATVTIPAGQSNAAFNLTLVDDALLNGARAVTISAFATNLLSTTARVVLQDNEAAALGVVLPGTVAENAGTLVNQGRVTCTAAPSRNIDVLLNSSDLTALQVPAAVTIPAGQTSVVFSVSVINDGKIDGPQVASVTATVPGWTGATNSVTVSDDENTLLQLSGPALLSEGSGPIIYKVDISGTLSTNVDLMIASSQPDQLSVPESAVIAAGQTSVVFVAMVNDDGLFDGSNDVQIIAVASGFTPIFTKVTVLDNEVHHFAFGAMASSRTSTVPFSVSLYARDAFDGPVTNYNGPVTLSGAGSGGLVTLTSSNIVLSAGQWTGNLAVFTAEAMISLRATDAGGTSGQSVAFIVVPPLVYLANINAVDVASSQVSERLWALVSTNSTLVPIDPLHCLIEPAVAAGSGADRVVSSGDGRYAHIGRGTMISRFDTLARATNLTWSHPDGWSVEDFATVPGNSDSIAVTWMQPGWSPRNRGCQIYDGGVPRIPGGFGAGNLIEFSESPTRLYGYVSEISGFEFVLLNVGQTNVTHEKTVSLMKYYGANYKAVGKYIFAFTSGGGVYDPERGVYVGGFSYDTPYIGDSSCGRVYKFEPSPGRLVTSDLETLVPIASQILPGVSNGYGSMVRWGSNGLAFRANSAQLAILRSATVTSGPPADISVAISAVNLPGLVSNLFQSTIILSNSGPSIARNVVLAELLPTNSAFVSAVLSSGSYTQSVNSLVCSIGDLAAGEASTIRLVLLGRTPGLSVAKLSVTADSPDPDRANNVIEMPVSIGRAAPSGSVTEIRQVTADLAWNAALGRIFASVPHAQPLLGSTLLSFDPLTGAFDAPLPTGYEPGKLAVSANGQFVYVGINIGSSIQRFDASNRVADLTFPTGFGNVSDIEVLPDDPRSVVATVHSILAVYENGVQRSNVVGATEYNHHYYLALSSPSNCYVTYPTGFRRVQIDANGATLLSDQRDTVVTYQDWQIDYGAGRMFTPGGRVFDPVAGTNVTVLPYSGLVAADENCGRVFYLVGSGSSWTLNALNITNFQLAGSVAITNVSGTPSSLIRWGEDGLAFRTSGGQIFLVRTTLADDRDQDSLADNWETRYFGSITAYGPGDDPDGDTFTNLQEQQAGLDPATYDALRILWAKSAATRVELAVLGPLGSSHALMGSGDLVSWEPLLKFTCTNLPTLVVDLEPPTAGRNYRVAPLDDVPGPRLELRAPGLFDTNGVLVNLRGVPGFAYRIESSSNLENWAVLTNLLSTNRVMRARDLPLGQQRRRFYRAVTDQPD